jgi:rubredoxin
VRCSSGLRRAGGQGGVVITIFWEELFMQKFECGMCEYTYDPAKGDPGRGIPPGTSFDDLPDKWTCPKCNAGKNMFVAVEE